MCISYNSSLSGNYRSHLPPIFQSNIPHPRPKTRSVDVLVCTHSLFRDAICRESVLTPEHVPSRYEFYYDIVLRGQYTFHLRTLHNRYGPIIRINPYEVHISDPSFYDTLYASSASGEKRDRWEWSAKQYGIPGAMISTIGHEHHKARRAAVSRYFSMASVRKLQPVIEERVRQLIERIRGFRDVDGGAFKADHLFAAFTNGRLSSPIFPWGDNRTLSSKSRDYSLLINSQDVVTEYSYGRSEHLLSLDDFGSDFHNAFLELAKGAALLRHMYWIFQLIQSLPEWLAVLISPSIGVTLQLRQVWASQHLSSSFT